MGLTSCILTQTEGDTPYHLLGNQLLEEVSFRAHVSKAATGLSQNARLPPTLPPKKGGTPLCFLSKSEEGVPSTQDTHTMSNRPYHQQPTGRHQRKGPASTGESKQEIIQGPPKSNTPAVSVAKKREAVRLNSPAKFGLGTGLPCPHFI